jgi:hypothetical protein
MTTWQEVIIGSAQSTLLSCPSNSSRNPYKLANDVFDIVLDFVKGNRRGQRGCIGISSVRVAPIVEESRFGVCLPIFSQ